MGNVWEAETTRRSYLTLAAVGITSLSGCSGEDDEQPESAPDDHGGGDENPAELVRDHLDALADRSYTLDVEFEGDVVSDDGMKSVEYQVTADREAAVLIQSSNKYEIIDELREYFAQGQQHIEFELTDGERSETSFPVAESPPVLNGSSIFQVLFVGSILESKDDQTTSSSVEQYRVTDHLSYNTVDGHAVVTDEGVLTEFELEWGDAGAFDNRIALDITDVGETDVTLPA